MAEWLGSGLQNHLQRFESAWYLLGKRNFIVYQGIALFYFGIYVREGRVFTLPQRKPIIF